MVVATHEDNRGRDARVPRFSDSVWKDLRRIISCSSERNNHAFPGKIADYHVEVVAQHKRKNLKPEEIESDSSNSFDNLFYSFWTAHAKPQTFTCSVSLTRGPYSMCWVNKSVIRFQNSISNQHLSSRVFVKTFSTAFPSQNKLRKNLELSRFFRKIWKWTVQMILDDKWPSEGSFQKHLHK
jgi:hypothetical protein